MKHIVDSYNDESGCGSIIFSLIIISIIGAIFYTYEYKSAEQLQTILKNECGMDYTVDKVRRNGDNLSRICGLKDD